MIMVFSKVLNIYQFMYLRRRNSYRCREVQTHCHQTDTIPNAVLIEWLKASKVRYHVSS